MSKTIGAADLAAAVAAAVASAKHRPEPVIVGLVAPAVAWPKAIESFGGTRPSFAPNWRARVTPARATSSFEGWRGNA